MTTRTNIMSTHERFDGYAPPDPDEEGLTPYQVAEREVGFRKAFLILTRSQMTPSSARLALDMPLRDLARQLDIDDDQARTVKEEAWRFLKAEKENA